MTDEERIRQAMEECGLTGFRIEQDEYGPSYHALDDERFSVVLAPNADTNGTYWSLLCSIVSGATTRDCDSLDEAIVEMQRTYYENLVHNLRQRIAKLAAAAAKELAN